MKLLVFAHRGEAQIFLKSYDCKAHKRLKELYIGDDLAILITGEGIYSSINKLSFAIALIDNCSQVINLGICGALNKEVPLSSNHIIRTIYAEDEFKSYTFNQEASIDLITSKTRVLNESKALELSHFADLVDREAWAYAYVAKEYNLPFVALKHVSDHITDAEVCKIIREKSEFYSNSLYEFFLETITDENQEMAMHKIFSHPELHLTLSQKREYINYIQALSGKLGLSEDDILERCHFENIIKQELTGKNKTRLILSALHDLLYPFKTKVQTQLDDLTRDLKKFGADFKFDRNLEKVSFNFNAFIDSEAAKDQMAENLKRFPWQDFEKIMQGDIDV